MKFYITLSLLVFSSILNAQLESSIRDHSFRLIHQQDYVLNAWVREIVEEPQTTYISEIEISFQNEENATIMSYTFTPSGGIIDNWQRIIGTFTVPELARFITINLINKSSYIVPPSGEIGPTGDPTSQVYFDDIRIHPINGNLKSFVYDARTQRLMAELDENNYSTFYEYDKEGGLVRVKKETEKGIYTIQETRSSTVKNNN